MVNKEDKTAVKRAMVKVKIAKAEVRMMTGNRKSVTNSAILVNVREDPAALTAILRLIQDGILVVP